MNLSKKQFSVSLQALNQLNLIKEMQTLKKTDIDCIHFDVMDGHFAPNMAFNRDQLKSLQQQFSIPFQVHLMTRNVKCLVERYLKLQPSMIIIHVEEQTITQLLSLTKKIQKENVKVGWAFQTKTLINTYLSLLKNIDMVLIMSVKIGFAGSNFQSFVLKKAVQIRKHYSHLTIGIDGGVRNNNYTQILDAGFNHLVLGSILKDEKLTYQEIISNLRKK